MPSDFRWHCILKTLKIFSEYSIFACMVDKGFTIHLFTFLLFFFFSSSVLIAKFSKYVFDIFVIFFSFFFRKVLYRLSFCNCFTEFLNLFLVIFFSRSFFADSSIHACLFLSLLLRFVSVP